jgi:predicted O-methyltransferase YrrM
MTNVCSNVIGCLTRDIAAFQLRRIRKGNIIKPMMTAKEENLILEILAKKKPKKCLEWGAGYSTVSFPQHLTEDAEWISIEHDKTWFEKIDQYTKHVPKIKCYYVPPNNQSWKVNSESDGTLADFEDYVNFPKKLHRKFNFILIDGRARNFCIRSSVDLLAPEGIVILHDANRKKYHKYFQLFNHQLLFTDSRHNSGGLWIGSKSKNLKNVLDIKKHKIIWNILAKSFEPLQWSLSNRLN